MAGLIVAVALLTLLVVVWLATNGAATADPHREAAARQAASDRAELEQLRALVDEVREVAWDQRDINPELSTVVLDLIRAHERRRRRE